MVACCDSELDCVVPLFLAVTTGDLAKVKQALICTNPNISAGGMRPLHIAARNGYLEIVELLLEHGANPNVQDNDGRTPLHYAVENCHVGVARVLLDHGADPTIRDNNGMTPLDYGSNCEEFIEELRRRSTGTTVYE
jgi:ankyrin repeat protein